MRKVCHISTVHDPLDVRVFYKECVSLVDHFETFLVIRSDEKASKFGVNMIPLRSFRYKWARVLFAPIGAFFKGLKTKGDLFHLHDPELLIIAPLFKLLGKKVIFDKHENIAGQIMSKSWMGPNWIRSIVSGIYKLAERIFTSFCDKVVVVIPEMIGEFLEGKAILVRNFPSQKAFEDLAIDRDNSVIKFVYAGGLTPERGILEVLKAFAESGLNAQLLLIGRWSSNKFKMECTPYMNSENVKYLGYLPMDQVYEIYGKCHVGLCVLHPTENYKRSLPVKVFEYYFAGLQVVMSNIEYWEKEFGNRAFYTDPHSHQDLVSAFKNIGSRLKERVQIKDHSTWAKSNFSWESEFKKLLSGYHELLSH